MRLMLQGAPVAVTFTAEAIAALPEALAEMLAAAGWRTVAHDHGIRSWAPSGRKMPACETYDDAELGTEALASVGRALNRSPLDVAIACGGKVVPREATAEDVEALARHAAWVARVGLCEGGAPPDRVKFDLDWTGSAGWREFWIADLLAYAKDPAGPSSDGQRPARVVAALESAISLAEARGIRVPT